MGDITKGKKLLMIMTILVLGVSVYTTVISFLVQGSSGLLSGIIRTAVEGLLLYFIFKGKKWAKITLVTLLSIAILGAIVGLAISINAMLIALLISYVGSIYIITFSPSVKEYFKSLN